MSKAKKQISRPAKKEINTKDLVYCGLLAALCAIATSVHIPLGAGAMVHLGSAAIYTTAILFGGLYAGVAGAVGSALFDLLMGFTPYTPWSFFIKGLAGVLAGMFAHHQWPGRPNLSWLVRAFAGCGLASLWTLGGYLAAWYVVTGSWAVALGNAPASLLTSGTGIILALLLASRLRRFVK